MEATPTIKVNGVEATSFKSGDTVTVELQYSYGFYTVTGASAKTAGGADVEVSYSGSVDNGSNGIVTYTFTMPDDDVVFTYCMDYDYNEGEIW